MSELNQLFTKIAVGLKTKAAIKAYKAYKVKKKLEDAEAMDAKNRTADYRLKK